MTSCTSIESEIAALRADVAALNNKFATKSELESLKGQVILRKEFESYKQYVEKNFDAISQVTRYLVNEVKRFTEAKYQELGYTIKDAISDFHRDMDAIRGKINELIGKPESKPPLPDLSKFERKDLEHDSRLSQLSRELQALRQLIKDWQGSDKAIHEMKSRIAILERALESEKVKRESVDRELREAQERNKNSLMVELEKRLQAERQARNVKDIDLERQIDIIEDILKNRGDNKDGVRDLERQLGILKNALESERKKRELMDGYLSRKLETVDDDWQRQLNEKLKQEENKRNAKDNQLDSTDKKILTEIADLRKSLPLSKRVERLEKQVDKIWGDLRIKTAEITQTKLDIGAIWTYLKTALPALIKSIVWSILLSAAFNALIAGLMGAFNDKLAQDAWGLALKAFGVAKKAESDTSVAKELAINGYSLANKANDKADIAINRIDGLKEEIDGIVANALAAMKRLENEIKFITEAARQAMLRLQGRIENLETYTGELSKIVQNQWNQITDLSSQVSNLTTFVNVQIANIQKTVDQFKIDLLKQIQQLQTQIPNILGKIALFTAQIAGILFTIAGIQALLSKLKPGVNVINNFITNNQTHNHLHNYDNRTTIVNQQSPVDMSLLHRIDQTTTTNLGVSTTHYALGKVMDEKLGPAITQGGKVIGLSGKLIQGFNWLIIDRALNVLTLGATIHNAAMLSSNIIQTLTQAMQNIVDLVGLKTDKGDEFQIGEAINSSISNAVKSVVGKDNYEAFMKQWNHYNRIYQAGANLFSSLLSMGDSIVNALQIIGGQTGKIGNALKIWGVVGEKAYGWFNPQPNFSNPLFTKLDSLQETASTIENVTQQPLTIKQEKESLENAAKELADSLNQTNGSDGKPQPEPSKLKQAANASKDKIPTFATISLADIFNAND